MAFTDLLTLVRKSDNKLFLFSEKGHFIKYISDKNLVILRALSIASDGRIITIDCLDYKIKVLSPYGNDVLQSFSAPYCFEPPNWAICHQDNFFLFLITLIIVLRYLTKQECIYMTLAERGPMMASLIVLVDSLLTSTTIRLCVMEVTKGCNSSPRVASA